MAVGDRVAYDETFAATHVLVPHGRELHLAGGVKDVEQGGLIVDDRLLLVGVLCSSKKSRKKTGIHLVGLWGFALDALRTLRLTHQLWGRGSPGNCGSRTEG